MSAQGGHTRWARELRKLPGQRSRSDGSDGKGTLMNVDRTKLRGKRIAILAADGFEYIELVVPQRALRAAGAEVDIISLHRGKIRGMSLADVAGSVRVDRTLDETDPGAYDGLYIPGGFIGPDFLRQ